MQSILNGPGSRPPRRGHPRLPPLPARHPQDTMTLKRPTSRQLSIAAAVLALLAAIVFIAVRSGPLSATRVTVVKVAEASLSPSLFGTGTVEARRAWLIGPTAAGRVLRVMVDVGDSVKAGQLLAEMDPVDLQERLAALSATQARATSAHRRRRSPGQGCDGPARTGGHQRAPLPGLAPEGFHQPQRGGGQGAGTDLGRRRPERRAGQPGRRAPGPDPHQGRHALHWRSSARTCACWRRPTAS